MTLTADWQPSLEFATGTGLRYLPQTVPELWGADVSQGGGLTDAPLPNVLFIGESLQVNPA